MSSSSSKPTPILGCVFYKTAAGGEPVREWLWSLTVDVRRQIGADINLVQWTWPVGRPLVGKFGAGLCEVITTYDKNEYRVLFIVVDDAMLLLHGFHKKTRKTSRADLDIARRRRKEGDT